jgi:hypothetical protein
MPLLSACATDPKRMSVDDINKIRNVAVVTKLEDNTLNVLDISGIRTREYSKQYGGVMFGALGGALEALIIEGISSYKIHSAIGGSINPIQESVADFDAETAFNDVIYTQLPEHIKAGRDIKNILMLKADNFIETEDGIRITSEEKDNCPDTLLKIEYRYGIGAVTEKKPVPAIVANISVISIPENKRMMRDTMIVYSCDDNDYTLADYAENNGKVYRQCFGEIVEKLCQQLATSYF